MNPRTARLWREFEEVKALCASSDLITYETINHVSGMPPEQYLIHYHIESIIGINTDESPIYGNLHTLKVIFPAMFPMVDIPSFTMLTDTWHPNINHGGEFKGHVCTNKEEHNNNTSLEDFILFIGEILQWKNYHAVWVLPYPQDTVVAKWVLDYAEPNGIVGGKKRKVIDERPLIKPSEEWEKTRIPASKSTSADLGIEIVLSAPLQKKEIRHNKPNKHSIEIEIKK